jgi:hypothetical protein
LERRISRLKEKLDSAEGFCFVGWISPFYTQDRPRTNLESSFLLACTKNESGRYIAGRFTGTLEQNEIKHQRILFEGESLVRIRNGPRANLVVKPQFLRFEESAVVAGTVKTLA